MSKKKAGRPTVMTEENIEEICTRLAGGESLRSICRDEGMPVLSTVLLAVVQNRSGFSERYAQARQAAGYAHADNVIEVTEAVFRGEIGAQEARAIMDGLKWAAERMAPNAHSAKQNIDHTTGGEKMTGLTVSFIDAASSKD